MGHQFVYTSAASGLKAGSQGYCMVAATQGLPQNLASQLESISGYKHLFKPNDPSNPVGYSHVVLRVSGKLYHVVSRVADAGLDYTNRSNLLAHHIAIDGSTPDGGPAWMLGPEQRNFLTAWSGDPRQLSPFQVRSGGDGAAVCNAWKTASGYAGWGGVLAASALSAVPGKVAIIYPPGLDMLPLLRESMALLPANVRWRVNFNTYFTQLLPGQECHWRCIPAVAPQAKKLSGMTVIDLTKRTAPPAGAGKDAAERGMQLGSAPSKVAPSSPHIAGPQPSGTTAAAVGAAAGARTDPRRGTTAPTPEGPPLVGSGPPPKPPRRGGGDYTVAGGYDQNAGELRAGAKIKSAKSKKSNDWIKAFVLFGITLLFFVGLPLGLVYRKDIAAFLSAPEGLEIVNVKNADSGKLQPGQEVDVNINSYHLSIEFNRVPSEEELSEFKAKNNWLEQDSGSDVEKNWVFFTSTWDKTELRTLYFNDELRNKFRYKKIPDDESPLPKLVRALVGGKELGEAELIEIEINEGKTAVIKLEFDKKIAKKDIEIEPTGNEIDWKSISKNTEPNSKEHEYELKAKDEQFFTTRDEPIAISIRVGTKLKKFNLVIKPVDDPPDLDEQVDPPWEATVGEEYRKKISFSDPDLSSEELKQKIGSYDFDIEPKDAGFMVNDQGILIGRPTLETFLNDPVLKLKITITEKLSDATNESSDPGQVKLLSDSKSYNIQLQMPDNLGFDKNDSLDLAKKLSSNSSGKVTESLPGLLAGESFDLALYPPCDTYAIERTLENEKRWNIVVKSEDGTDLPLVKIEQEQNSDGLPDELVWSVVDTQKDTPNLEKLLKNYLRFAFIKVSVNTENSADGSNPLDGYLRCDEEAMGKENAGVINVSNVFEPPGKKIDKNSKINACFRKEVGAEYKIILVNKMKVAIFRDEQIEVSAGAELNRDKLERIVKKNRGEMIDLGDLGDLDDPAIDFLIMGKKPDDSISEKHVEYKERSKKAEVENIEVVSPAFLQSRLERWDQKKIAIEKVADIVVKDPEWDRDSGTVEAEIYINIKPVEPYHLDLKMLLRWDEDEDHGLLGLGKPQGKQLEIECGKGSGNLEGRVLDEAQSKKQKTEFKSEDAEEKRKVLGKILKTHKPEGDGLGNVGNYLVKTFKEKQKKISSKSKKYLFLINQSRRKWVN